MPIIRYETIEPTYRYQFTTAEGASCCKNNNIDLLCEHCRAAAEAADFAAAEDAPPPDPYRAGLAELRTANAVANARRGHVTNPAIELPEDGTAPNGYANAIAQLRVEGRR